MNNGLHNSFPADKINKPESFNKKNKLSVLNVGQILALIILIIIICVQTLNILFSDYFNPAQDHIPEYTGTANENKSTGASQQKPEIISDSNAAEQSAHEPDIIFILGEINGKLAILGPDRETVHEIFDVYINTLPEYDRNLLIEGIKITTAEELGSLLEDYSS